MKEFSKEVQKKETEKENSRRITDAETEKKSNLFTEFNRDAEKIEALTNQINSFTSGEKLDRLSKIDTNINNINQKIVENEVQLEKLKPEVNKLQKKVDDQDAHKRNVESNIELHDIITGKQKIQDELVLLEQERNEFDVEMVERNNNAMQQRIRKIEVEISRCEGKKETLRSSQREVRVSSSVFLSCLNISS